MGVEKEKEEEGGEGRKPPCKELLYYGHKAKRYSKYLGYTVGR